MILTVGVLLPPPPGVGVVLAGIEQYCANWGQPGVVEFQRRVASDYTKMGDLNEIPCSST